VINTMKLLVSWKQTLKEKKRKVNRKSLIILIF